ncbi:hypothetical protein HU200_046965 [Digitaria exilis]|uniref:Uncharacterized protein n=1 Tax=Digitaria exilis TaxID=1010633 RepID=A0A835B479_9POAL|nr:hypothetical protein HU200_046965 [Digitaria exilis]
MPVAALHPLPAVVGPTGRSGVRRQARFGLRASSLESASSALTVPNGVAAGAAAVERKEKVKEDKDDVAAKEREEKRALEALYDDGFGSVTVKDYFAAAKAVSRDDGGPPRWFCPVECGRPAVDDAPPLLFLPGTDGVGMGLILHHKSLGKVFEVRCLHIPVNDRTPFEATSFAKTPLRPILPLLESMPSEFHVTVPYLLSFVMGDPLKMASVSIENNLSPPETLQKLSDSLTSMLPLLSGVNMYRRGRQKDFVTDYLPPTLSEFKKTFDEDHRLFHLALSPVMMSTLKNGEIVRDLSGIPDQGPVLFVGYHALLGIELSPLYEEFLREKKTIVRGMAHPLLFGTKFESSRQESSRFDTVSMYGGLPVTPINMYRLFERNEFVLLYPGGVREALHRKVHLILPISSLVTYVEPLVSFEKNVEPLVGEEYKLFWPDQPEFVRMAARFGVTVIPFGCVGEDDVLELVLDYNDQKNIPGLGGWIESINKETDRVRDSVKGEDGNQDMYLPGLLPKVPGRFYYLFGKPFEMKGMNNLVRDRKSANEVYLRIKSEVEEIMSYLKRKREEDPYRSIAQRALYQATWGISAQASYRGLQPLYDDGYQTVKNLDDYYESLEELVKHDSGPPRWFCPVDAGSPIEDAPLMLYLPDLVTMVEDVVRKEHATSPNRPIYLLGNSFGGCLALAVAARNPHIDLILVLVNPVSASGSATACQEYGVHVASIIKCTDLYRHSRRFHPVFDFIPPSATELKEVDKATRDLRFRTCPAMYSTLEDGTVVRGLAGVPQDGPVLLVGNHMLLGIELISLAAEFLRLKGVVVRGIAHPLLFPNKNRAWSEGHDFFDFLKLWGGVPRMYKYIYKLLAAGEFVLLYPGGHREALHCKGEEHRLFWPSKAEFVRLAAQFKATIVPFGVVGEDDLLEVLCTFEDIRNAPFGKEMMKAYSDHLKLRDVDHEVFFPGLYLKMPGRFYYQFGKPIPTKGRQDVLTDKQAAHDLYMHVKSEVERIISYLLEKRMEDKYRSLIPRMLYQAARGPTCEVPAFDP